ncbi:MAG: hypothetical protein RL377_86 [Bacteroidota bacterium]
MIIYSRSPYFITVNESAQVGSRIELRLWNGTGSAPTPATYTFSKSIASSTQIENIYNISPFVKEYIDNIAPDYASGETDSTSMWVNVEVKRYKETSVGTYSLLDTTTYLGTNGYTQFLDGYNYTNASNTFMLLSDNTKEIRYDITKSIPYVNVLISPAEGDVITATYKDLRGRNEVVVGYTETKGMLKIPLATTNAKYNKGNTLTISYNDTDYVYNVMPICEPKYAPVICSFISRFGGWQFLTFFKAQTNNINVNGSNFNLLQDSIDYNTSKGQSKSFNINGKQSVKLSSGFVPENYSDLIQDLLLSETVLLDGKPAEVKTQATTLKTSLQDRNINYEIEFDYAFNLINNVI